MREQVFFRLKEALFSGKLVPGQRLTEGGIAEFLGVSRTPTREALAILHQEGTLVRRSTGGYEVTIPTMEKAAEIFQVRRLLEPFAARLAAENASDKDIHKLKTLIGVQRENLSSKDPVKYLEPDRELRRLIVDLSGNRQLVECIARYEDHLQLVASLTLRSPSVRQIALGVDEPIVEAIAARDPRAAEDAVHRQLEATREVLTEVLQDVLNEADYA